MRKILVVVLSLVLSGCGVVIPAIKSQSRLNALALGMTKEEARKIVGKAESLERPPVKIQGAVYELNEHFLYGKSAPIIQVIEGPFLLTISWWIPWHWFTSEETFMGKLYSLYYVNGKLAFWSKKGDRMGAPKEILEFIE